MPGAAAVTVNSDQWNVWVASTYSELTTGLSERGAIPAGTGMLFVLPAEQVVSVDTTWMSFPLDIIFISNNTVVDVARNIEPGYLVTEETPCDSFLEVNAGEAVAVESGDMVNTAIIQQGFDFSQIMSFAMPLATLGFVCAIVGGMASMMSGSSHSSEEPVERVKRQKELHEELARKTFGKSYDELTPVEQTAVHSEAYLLERGGHPTSEEEATFPPEARKDLTFCKHMWDLEKTMGRSLTREEVAQKWEAWKELRYRPKTEEERKLVHSLKYGVEELPERGKGMRERVFEGGFEVEWQDWSGTWRHWATLWNREAAEAEAMEARKRLPGMEVRVRPVSGSNSNPAKEYKVHFIGACKVVDGLCHTHGYSVSKAVKCPESPLTDEEWAAAWELAEVAYPEGMSNPWVNGWWPETLEEAEGAAREYEWKMRDAIRMFREKQAKAMENYERGADKAVYNYRRYVVGEYEKGRELSFIASPSEHHSMWLTLEQRKELEKKYGMVAVRWAEEATRPGDIKAAETAAEYYYGKLKEVFGLGHLSPELSEEQIMKLREVLGLPKEVPPREKGYIE